MQAAQIQEIEQIFEKVRRLTYGSHDNTAHVWAQQSVEKGGSSDDRMFFDGPSIYSYGRHFEIARFLPFTFDGRRVVLFNSSSYSPSTGKHKSIVRRSLKTTDVCIHVEDLTQFKGGGEDKLDAVRTALIRDIVRWEARRQQLGEAFGYASQYGIQERAAFDAFVTIYKLAPLPKDPAAFVAKLDAKLAAEKLANEIERARVFAENAVKRGLIRDVYNTVEVKRDFDPKSAQIEHVLKEARSHKRVLDKAKVAAKLRDGLWKQIKHWTAKRDEWIAAERTFALDARDNERRVKIRDALAYWRGTLFVSDWPFHGEILRGLVRDAAGLGFSEAEVAELYRYVSMDYALKEQVETFDLLHPDAYVVRNRRNRTPWQRMTADEWLAGKQGRFAQTYPTLVRKVGERLETSRGAVAPFNAAVAVYLRASRCIRDGERWHANGERLRVGPFEADTIDENGNLTIGCHEIAFAEMERLAVKEVPDRVKARFPLPAVI